MAAISLTTAGRANVVESIIQATLSIAETVAVGNAVRLDVSTGKWTKANGSSAAEARIYGIVVDVDGAGSAVTVLRKGVLDGFNLTSLAYDAAVYLSDTDGGLDTAAGTVSTVIGRVIPGTAVTTGTALDKLLFIDL